MQDLIGKTLSGCRITRKIGEGGMGVVYEAEQPSLNRKVAIKFLAQSLIHDKDFVERFFREARSAAGLSHPNILHIYSVDQQEDMVYMVTEYVTGSTLKSTLSRKKILEEAEAFSIVRDIASALTAAEKAILDFLSQRGANHLLVSAIGQAQEELLGYPISDLFALSFGTEVSPQTATGLWEPVVEATSSFHLQLQPAAESGQIRDDQIRSDAQGGFHAQVHAAIPNLEPRLATFRASAVADPNE